MRDVIPHRHDAKQGLAGVVPTQFKLYRPRQYEYAPLATSDTIRLFSLSPAEDATIPLEGSVLHVSRYAELAKPSRFSKYAAVSYVWGTESFSKSIGIHSAAPAQETVLPITPTVEVMLKTFRHTQRPRLFWIDAICLNQRDDDEKSQQIPLMGEIYSQAHKVLFWLGTEEGYAISEAFAFCRHAAVRPLETRIQDFFDEDAHAASSMKNIIRRPFFYRRWILQEISLARHAVVWCGRHSVPWSTLLSGCHWLVENGMIITAEEYCLRMATTLLQKSNTSSALLWHLHQSKCTDKRDYIAALYGLSPRAERLTLDYAMSYQRVFIQHASSMISSLHQYDVLLHLFNFGSLVSCDDRRYPSWIPDWTAERQSPGIPLFYNLGDIFHVAPNAEVTTFSQWKKHRGSLMMDKAPLPDWMLWKEWFYAHFQRREKKDGRFHLSIRAGKRGRNVLNLSWDGQTAGTEEYQVERLVDFGAGPGPGKVSAFRDSMRVLLGKRNRPYTNPMPETWAWNLAALFENVMTTHCSRTLAHYTGLSRKDVMIIAVWWAITGRVAFNRPEQDDYTEQELEDIIVELVTIFRAAKLVVAKVSSNVKPAGRAAYLCKWVICPCSIEQEDVLIPLHTGYDFENMSEDGESSGTAPWTGVPWCPEWQGPGTRKRGGIPVNLIAVRLATSISPRPISPSALRRVKGMSAPSAAIQPRQARYVGPCLGLLEAGLGHLTGAARRDHEASNAVARASQGYTHDEAQEQMRAYHEYEYADAQGLPPPFTVDIV
ncbi:hypothetical protein ACN47E_008005 [Coniothyrium glycines]